MKRQSTIRRISRSIALCGAFVLLLVPASVSSSGITANQACATGERAGGCEPESNVTCLVDGELRQNHRPAG